MLDKQDFNLDSRFQKLKHNLGHSLINHGDLARTNVQFVAENKGFWPFITLLVEIMEYLFRSGIFT